MARSFAAFISHASQDRRAAERIETALGRDRVWFDRSDIRLGALLGHELLSNLRNSRVLVLVWSTHAQRSPWVQSEWISAVNLRHPVIPVVLDRTPLPQALANTLWVPWRRASRATLTELARAVGAGRRRDGSISSAMRLPDSARDSSIDRLARAQDAMFGTWSKDGLTAARHAQRRLEPQMAALVAHYPLDSRVAALWAYHAKNGVLLDHDAEITAGIRVTDERLNDARWRFLRALWLDPLDAGALNGLGTIAWFDHDLDTAEFFVRAALAREPGYPAAAHDLRLILQLRGHARAGDHQTWTGAEDPRERAVPILPADDLAAARTFYVDTLGFTVTFDTSEQARVIDAFHDLYYNGRRGEGPIFQRTRWLGVQCPKCPLDLWIYQEPRNEPRRQDWSRPDGLSRSVGHSPPISTSFRSTNGHELLSNLRRSRVLRS